FGIRQLDILDDNFNFDQTRAKQILELIIAKDYDLAINMQNGMRADNADSELLDKMKKAGIFKISFGIESADPVIQKRIKKKLDLDKALFTTREAQRRNIIVYTNSILGLPGDTPESMQRTIDFAIKMAPDIANFMIALPLPGTELYEEIKTNGRFLIPIENGVEKGFYAHKVFYELGSMRAHEVLRYYRKAYQKFYSRISWFLLSIKNIRSLNELMWFKDAIIDLTKNIIFK
ncbi:MAG: radical SAM protein, partial [Candidatus Omnitrophica bacterium]|nr:radical SAM protein [Candidatus Omnitrophota bacterium]